MLVYTGGFYVNLAIFMPDLNRIAAGKTRFLVSYQNERRYILRCSLILKMV